VKPHDLARIRDSAGWRRNRTEAFETDDGPVIVKGQRPPRPAIAALLLGGLAQLTRSPELRPVPAPGGTAGQEIELRRLSALRDAGVKVPTVLHVAPDFFVMERLSGPNVAGRLAAAPSDLRLWVEGLRFIAHVHERGQYLSQASARNLIATESGIAAIDFEDDPLQAMTLPQAQARDWLLYLQSTVWLLPQPHEELLRQWETVAPAGVAAGPMLRAVRRAAWMRHLPSRRKPWGRDIVSAQAAAALLHAWAERRPLT
jgi:hypothetical protein